MPTGLAVALAGAVGAFGRYLFDYHAGDHLEPHHQVYATLTVNVIGAFLLGVLIGIHPEGRTRIILGVGLIASFTTFSTVISQIYHALDAGRYATAIILPTISVILGVLALSIGVAAAYGYGH